MVRSAPFDGPFVDAPPVRFVCRKARPENGRTVSSHLTSAVLRTRWRRLPPSRADRLSSQTPPRRGLNHTILSDIKESFDVDLGFNVLFCEVYTINPFDWLFPVVGS